MNGLIKRLQKPAALFDKVIRFLVIFSFGLLLFAVLIVCVAVVSRYVLNRPLTWVEQISGYILVYMVFLNAAWVLKKERHVKLDLLLLHLNHKTQTWFNMVTSFLGALICVIITWFGAELTWDYFRRGVVSVEMLQFPMYIIWGVIPLGGFLLVIQFLRRGYGFLTALRTGADDDPGQRHDE